MAGLYHFTTPRRAGHEAVTTARSWSPGLASGFDVDLNLDDLRNKQRDEIREALLVEQSRQST